MWTNEETLRLYSLAHRLLDAKADEEIAKQQRINLELQIASLVPIPNVGFHGTSKQQTVTLADGCKVVVKRGNNYKANEAACDKIIEVAERIDKHPPVKTKKVLDEKGYEWYRKNDPETFALFAEYVSVTPAKPSVTVELSKEK